MDETVVLCLLKYFKGFFPGDIAAVFLGFHHIVGHIPYSHAPALRVIPAAFVMIEP